MKELDKKGAAQGIGGIIMGIGGAAVVLIVIMIIIAETKLVETNGVEPSRMNASWYCHGGTYNGTPLIGCIGGTPKVIPESYTSGVTLNNKLGTVPTWVGLVIIASFAAIVMGYFYVRQ